MNNFKVSILIPVYKVENYIEKCARSLFEQTYFDIEYIFVNDFTPDNSIKIIDRILADYPNRKNQVKVLHHEKNLGLAVARNTALDNASGEYILHVDGDDYLELNAVEILLRKVFTTNADIIVFDSYWIEKDAMIPTHRNIGKNKEQYIKKILTFNTAPSIWGVLIKRNLYLESGVRAVSGLNYSEDYSVTPRLLYYASKIAKENACLYYYLRTNINSYTYSMNIKNVENFLHANRIVTEFFASQSDFTKYKEYLILGKINIKRLLLEQNVYSTKIEHELFANTASLISIKMKMFLFLINNAPNFLTKIYSRLIRIFLRLI
jgi:glycosyltransferase involved in cell wall biosynthesis